MARDNSRYAPAKNRNSAGQGLPGMGGMRNTPIGGLIGSMPGGSLLVGDGQQDITKQRQQTIDKAVGLLDETQPLQYKQRNANLQGLAQLFAPANNRLARLYGDEARVNMPMPGGPLAEMFAQAPGGRAAPMGMPGPQSQQPPMKPPGGGGAAGGWRARGMR